MARKIRNYLFKSDTVLARLLNVIVIGFILVSVSIIPLYFIYHEGPLFNILLFIERIVVTLFIFEFLFRILSTAKPSRYIMSKWGLINFLSILPLFLYNLGFFSFFPAFLLIFRVFRVFEFARFPRIEEMDYKTMKKYGHFTLLKDEKLLKIVQKHVIVFLVGLLLPLFMVSSGVIIMVFFEFHIIGVLIGAFFLLFAVLFFIKIWLDFRYDVLFITDIRVIVQERELFGTVSDKVNYESIAVIVPDNKGFFKMIFRYGHLEIRTPSDSKEIRFSFAPRVDEVADMISQNRNEVMKSLR